MSTLRIVDAPLLPNVDGTEKIPTGGRGDYAVSVDQIKEYARGGLPQQIEDHINDTENPHQVSKSQVGLGNVDNTSDADKPISTATQAALTTLTQNKADKSTVYTKTEMDGSLNLKADKNDTYTKSQVDTAVASVAGGGYGYATLAEAQAATTALPIPQNSIVTVTNDTTLSNNGDYQWDGTTLTKSAYDPLTQAKSYTDQELAPITEIYKRNDTNLDVLYEYHDINGELVAYMSNDGQIYTVGSDKSIQELISINAYENKLNMKLSMKLNMLSDEQGRALISSNVIRVYDDLPIKKSMIIENYGGAASTTARIPAALKLANNKILYMWGQGVGSPYNGDSEGVRLYKRILTYSDDGTILDTGTKELFYATPDLAGIAKHQMIGRDKNGRIIMLFDMRDGPAGGSYTTMLTMSTDEGLTFTTPVVVPSNPLMAGQVMGSAGTIVTLSTGRLVCPIYYLTKLGLMYSDDDGETWQYGSVFVPSVNIALYEPSITVDENDIIYITSRMDATYRKHLSKSIDHGVTITEIGINDDLVSATGASAILYDKANKLMLHGTPANPSATARTDYRIQISGDLGQTWKIGYAPMPANLYLAYSQMISLTDSLYMISVEGFGVNKNDQSVGAIVFNLKEVFSNVSFN